MTDLPARRLLLVHAHPDDESINNGATMATYAAHGAHVTLVTCTLGEEGEVIPAELADLAADRRDALGPHRATELAAAMRALGVTDHRFLGGPGRFRDSGMMGAPQNDRPAAFWQAPLDEAAGELVEVVRETRPQVLVTYGPDGGYGHPDHIQAHRVATRAVELAAEPDYRPETGAAHSVAKVYWNCVPRPLLDSSLTRLRAGGDQLPFPAVASTDDVPGVVDEEWVTAVIDGERHRAAKSAALEAHRTQVTVHGATFALSNDLAQPLLATEYYHLAAGGPGTPLPETDLFAGVTA